MYINYWPNFKEETTDLNYVVGYTGHMNIFTGRKHDGESKVFGEYDIHKLTSSEMIWYCTDSKEELARFKKVNNSTFASSACFSLGARGMVQGARE